MGGSVGTTNTGARIVVGILLFAYVVGLAALLQLPYDVAGGVLVLHVLALFTIPLLIRLTRGDGRSARRLLLFALAAKLVGTLVRYAFVFAIYGEGDARQYDLIGRALAADFRQGHFAVDLGGKVIGTGFIEVLTGVLYTIIGPTRLGGFFVYSWLGFWGLYLFWRAFRIAFPHLDHRRYGILLFFLPSMVFWPSSIGKDAWMTLTLGLIAYGTARMVARQGNGLLWVALGGVGSAMVRPHITLTAIVALIVAYLLTGTPRRTYAAAFTKMVGIGALGVMFVLSLSVVTNYLKLDDGGSIEEAFDRTQERTDKGGSGFESVSVRSPVQVPLAVFSVLFRPLPFEARNAQALFASLEGTVLLALFIRHFRRLGNFLPRRRAPFLAFAGIYAGIFVVAFSNISNFGILARQRVQLFPFVLVALAVPVAARGAARRQRAEVPPPVAVEARRRARAAVGLS
jgi:hypothetical protein